MALSDLHRCVQHPARVAILVVVGRSPERATFPSVRDEVGLTDGNLNRHLKVLLEERWVVSRRVGRGRGSMTTLRLTDAGRRGLGDFRDWCLGAAAEIDGSEGSVERTVRPMGASSGDSGGVLVDDRSRGWATELS